jgi:hypothetical protein
MATSYRSESINLTDQPVHILTATIPFDGRWIIQGVLQAIVEKELKTQHFTLSLQTEIILFPSLTEQQNNEQGVTIAHNIKRRIWHNDIVAESAGESEVVCKKDNVLEVRMKANGIGVLKQWKPSMPVFALNYIPPVHHKEDFEVSMLDTKVGKQFFIHHS